MGESLARIYRYQGYKVSKEYYLNDSGKQIVGLINSIDYYYRGLFEKEQTIEKENLEYPGIASQDAALFLKKNWNDFFLKEKLNKKEEKIKKEKIISFFVKKIKKNLLECGVSFNNWTSENKFYQKNKKKIEQTLKEWKKKGIIYEKEETIFFKSEKADENDEKDRVLIKKNKEKTYFLIDIFYHQKKLETSDQALNIWGVDHHGYLKRILGACQLLGFAKEKIKILLTEKVYLLSSDQQEKLKFSKRMDNIISLEEALKETTIDCLRFFFLEKEVNKEILINLDILKQKKEKNLSFYIKYAFARCCQLIKKSKEKKIRSSSKVYLLNLEERKLLNSLLNFNKVIEKVILFNSPHILLHFLLKLSQNWQSYYQQNKILDEKEKKLSSQKLFLTKKIGFVLKKGLQLLGLETLSEI